MKQKKMLFRALAVLLLLAIAVLMFIIGRGHTVYFDNVAIEYGGKTYDAFAKAEVYVNGERVAKITDKARDNRGMTDTMGQRFSMTVKVTKEAGGKTTSSAVNMQLPYGIDGIVLNLPALLNGLPEDAYLSTFVPVATTAEDEEEVIITEEFELPVEE